MAQGFTRDPGFKRLPRDVLITPPKPKAPVKRTVKVLKAMKGK